jgi:hypothetical protein
MVILLVGHQRCKNIQFLKAPNVKISQRMKPHLPLIFCVILLSCRQLPVPAPVSLKDSVVRQYLHEIDSLGYDDTAATSVRVLRAYLSDDTAFLKKFDITRLRSNVVDKANAPADSCIHQPRLQDMPIDEGYQFVFEEAFTNNKLNLTVTKAKDSINLHFVLYDSHYNYDGTRGFVCRIKREYDKRLKGPQWDSLTSALQMADFWALSCTNNYHGVDGNTIAVLGYRRADRNEHGAPRLHRVERWLVGSTWLSDPFDLALRLSGERQNCIWEK